MNDRFRFIKDTGLKYIGKSKRQKYMFALFECPSGQQRRKSFSSYGFRTYKITLKY